MTPHTLGSMAVRCGAMGLIPRQEGDHVFLSGSDFSWLLLFFKFVGQGSLAPDLGRRSGRGWSLLENAGSI